MKIITMIIIFLALNNAINAVRIGMIRNVSLSLMVSSNITMNRSTCNECVCAMLMTSGNASIVSFNCYIKDIDRVVCQMFTIADYWISSFYQTEINFNSTFYFLQLPLNNQSQITTVHPSTTFEGSTYPMSTNAITTSPMTSVRRLVTITQPGDTIVGVYDTTAGISTGGKDGRYSSNTERPAQAIDNLTSTKYLNFGSSGDFGKTAAAPGVGTGFYVTPSISNASIAISLRFATGNDAPNRDPVTVTLEGTNSNALDNGLRWTLIYNGSTGIDPTADPGRMQYVTQQNFSNTIAYKSYRLLITSQRGPEWAVQYSEAQIIGYV